MDTQDQNREPGTPISSGGPFSTLRGKLAANLSRSESNTVSAVGSPIAASLLSNKSIDMDNPDPELVQKVGRHLVPEEQPFDSLQLQSGDITREIYNWQREHRTSEGQVKRGRSRSFDLRPEGHPEVGQARDMLVPGGFRREFVATHDNESVYSHSAPDGQSYGATGSTTMASRRSTEASAPNERPQVFTRNFIEFLSLYGHFAGLELEDIEEDNEEDEEQLSGTDERAPLLRSRHQQRLSQQAKGQASTTETVLLLLKSFVGTGVLFLPRAFYNGGLLFSSIVLVFVSFVSYWCFLLLIEAKHFSKATSFGDIGGALFGDRTRQIILGSIVVSQIGFASAYIVFVAENLRSFWDNVRSVDVSSLFAGSSNSAGNGALLSISTLIVLQLVVFLPLSMIRDIAKLGFTALVADAFILAGLIYLYSWSGVTLLTQGVADVRMFNSSKWTLFIGTAVFTYEGIGLIIPIQESMRKPQKFPIVLGSVMVGITVIFVSVGALLYAATGSKVETVILLNLPRGQLTNTVQLLYSLAILLSTPLQLFPAIRILETAIFVRSGKYSAKVKWQKNIFRFALVFLTGVVAYCGADDLDKFVALIGSVACVPLVYIYPPILHMKVAAPYSFAFYADAVLAVFGACIMGYTSFTTAMSWASS
nr:Avt3 [Starmerella bombicola]